MIATHSGEYLLLEACPPGRAPVSIGVLLHDPESARLGVKLRRDWDQFLDEDDREVFAALAEDLRARISEVEPQALLGQLEDSLSNILRVSERQSVLMGPFDRTLDAVYRKYVTASVLPFRTHLPVYSCRAAAGKWGEQMDVDAEPEQWIEAPESMRLTPDMFVAQVVGRSMEPLIPNGSLCAFRATVGGSRSGRRLLIENLTESEHGGERYTVKVYRSRKRQEEDGSWTHESVRLEPLNPEFEAWELGDGQFRVIGEFLAVLE